MILLSTLGSRLRALLQKHLGRFQLPMDHTVLVGKRRGLGDLLRKLRRYTRRQRAISRFAAFDKTHERSVLSLAPSEFIAQAGRQFVLLAGHGIAQLFAKRAANAVFIAQPIPKFVQLPGHLVQDPRVAFVFTGSKHSRSLVRPMLISSIAASGLERSSSPRAAASVRWKRTKIRCC